MILISKLIRIGIVILRQRNVSTGLMIRIPGGGDLLVGKTEFGKMLLQ